MLDESVKKDIRFIDGRHVASEGNGNIVSLKKDG